MKSFKPGDVAIINVDKPLCSPLKQGDVVFIISIDPYGTHRVRLMGGYDMYDLDAHCLDMYDEELPIGTQMELGKAPVCDCGGFKTYQSMSPEFHSTSLPCSSLAKK